MITLQTRFPYWADNIFQMKDQPVSYGDKKIGKIVSVNLGSDGIPLLTFKVYKKYYHLIKDSLL